MSIIETEHTNFLYIEQNTAPIITRWRVYLQSFSTLLLSIAGKNNTIADWMSRQYSTDNTSTTLNNEKSTLLSSSSILDTKSDQIRTNDTKDPDYYFSKVHGGVRGHPGSKRT